jgi:RNA polymerase sigma factor (sigma-70 family)
MNDRDAKMVWQLVDEYRRDQGGDTYILPSFDFEKVEQGVREKGRLQGVTDDDFLMVIAMCWFGPATDDVPPSHMRAALLALMSELTPDEQLRQKHIAEIVIAYGCGAWREVQDGEEGWENRWQGALDWVTHRTLGWMRATTAWLQFDVQLRGYAFTAPFPSWIAAEELASLLWLGKCDCWRLRVSDPEQPMDHRTARRATRCLREHRLSAWNPQEISLGNFIARAIKGDKVKGEHSSKKAFVSGAVEQGMFFCDLYRDYDIRLGRVLVWRCPNHPTDIFEEQACLQCEDTETPVNFLETLHERDVIRRLLVRAPTGPYQETQYWRCQQGDTYYQAHHIVCPRCHAPRTHGAAKSTVWELGRQPDWVTSSLAPWVARDDVEATVILREILTRLSPREREVLTLVKVEGLPERQVARQLGITTEELQSLLEKTISRLREALAVEEETRA